MNDTECFYDEQLSIYVFLCAQPECRHEECSISMNRAELDREAHYETIHPDRLEIAIAQEHAVPTATKLTMLLSA